MEGMDDLHVRVPESLSEAARERAALPPGPGPAALVRYALAKLAGWPEPAARQLALRGRSQ